MSTSSQPGTATARGSLLYTALGGALLLSAAIYNGYPLTFWDTRAYVEHAGSLLPRSDRLIGYSLWIRALSWKLSLWPVAAAQCWLTAWLVLRTLRTLTPRIAGTPYLLLMAAITAGTAAPWVAGQLMADIFTPMLVLALWLLLEDSELSGVARVGLLGLVAVSVAVHLTHFPIGLGLLLFSYLGLRARKVARPALQVRPALLALGLGLGGIACFNAARVGHLTLAAGSDAFLLGHLQESGIASVELNEHCPQRDYMLCPGRHQLPMTTDEFLWVDKLDLYPWKNTAAISREAKRLLSDSLREHPALHLQVAVVYTLRVLARFATGEGLTSDARDVVEPQIASFVPRDLPAYRAARQQHDALPIERLRSMHTPIGWAMLGLGFLLLLARARRLQAEPELRFLALAYASLLLNAAISANLSGVYDRYESRLVWILALGLWAAALRRLKTHTRESRAQS